MLSVGFIYLFAYTGYVILTQIDNNSPFAGIFMFYKYFVLDTF